jgi:hypothetical protein
MRNAKAGTRQVKGVTGKLETGVGGARVRTASGVRKIDAGKQGADAPGRKVQAGLPKTESSTLKSGSAKKVKVAGKQLTGEAKRKVVAGAQKPDIARAQKTRPSKPPKPAAKGGPREGVVREQKKKVTN